MDFYLCACLCDHHSEQDTERFRPLENSFTLLPRGNGFPDSVTTDWFFLFFNFMQMESGSILLCSSLSFPQHYI